MSGEGASAPAGARFLCEDDRAELSRVEDAGLNASAPPQQRWMDGWLVRTCPGKAQRARCINAVAAGRRSVSEKLAACHELYASLGLPMLVRITPFTQPPTLDAELAALGYLPHDDTLVMLLPRLDAASLDPGDAPAGTSWGELPAEAYAEAVGRIRGSSPAARRAHAERLRSAPVTYRGFQLFDELGSALACGQVAQEGSLAGLYDIATAPAHQRRGLGTWLCKRLLTLADNHSPVRSAYLQVGAENESARRMYRRMGFTDAYSYHYRQLPGASVHLPP